MATNRRARNWERPVQGTEGLERLAGLLERLVERPPRATRQPAFRVPDFDGRTDVQFFIRRFEDVSEANEWTPQAALLHLRGALKESAAYCGRADSVPGVFQALITRFGVSTREARTRLASVQKASQSSLAEHSWEVDRLVQIAYGGLPEEQRQQLALDTFVASVGNPSLQRHLLAVNPATLEEAVRAGGEYLQVKTPYQVGVRQVEGEDGVAVQPIEDPIATST